jgi:hypothetical protein
MEGSVFARTITYEPSRLYPMRLSPEAMRSSITPVVGCRKAPASNRALARSQKAGDVMLSWVARRNPIPTLSMSYVVTFPLKRFGCSRSSCARGRPRVRHVAGRQQALVIDEHDGLEGRAECLVAPHRPFGQARRLGGSVRLRMAVVHELHLHVHRRTPQHVGAGAARRAFSARKRL